MAGVVMNMKLDINKDQQGNIKMNPSWLFQTFILVILGLIGYFVDSSLQDIKGELEMSRVERAQIRADLTAFQIGASGDRFTGTMWRQERERIEQSLDEIKSRLSELEARR